MLCWLLRFHRIITIWCGASCQVVKVQGSQINVALLQSYSHGEKIMHITKPVANLDALWCDMTW
jgi:hypothetical protein